MKEIFHRTSVRSYTEQPVEQDKIEKILRAAMAAPSAHNQQAWEFYAVTNKDIIFRLSRATPFSRCAAKAPLVFVVCTRTECIRPEYVNIDASAAVENMLLEIDGLGLGAVWMGIAPHQDRVEYVDRIISIPEGLHSFALVACGYPATEKQQQDRYDPSRVHYVE